jgi:peptidoglycan/xylan/chitin deacetylase (PgdA/CDA1 family)
MVSDEAVPHVRHLYRFRSLSEFGADVEFFSKHFAPLALADLVAVLDGRQTLTRPSFHLTFDDGFREMHDIVAPVLRQQGVPATFFLNTAFLDGGGMAHHNVLSLIADRLSQPLPTEARKKVEALAAPFSVSGDVRSGLLAITYQDRSVVGALADAVGLDVDQYVAEARPYLSSDQIRGLLSQGFTIGAHSHDHPLYADLTLEQQLAQTRSSLALLEARFGARPRAFAFPHTDRGVAPEFFDQMFAAGRLDVSFGTGGLVRHFHPRNIERVGMEKGFKADRILARQYARALFHRVRTSAAGLS